LPGASLSRLRDRRPRAALSAHGARHLGRTEPDAAGRGTFSRGPRSRPVASPALAQHFFFAAAATRGQAPCATEHWSRDEIFSFLTERGSDEQTTCEVRAFGGEGSKSGMWPVSGCFESSSGGELQVAGQIAHWRAFCNPDPAQQRCRRAASRCTKIVDLSRIKEEDYL
jgi:hypothetical protein